MIVFLKVFQSDEIDAVVLAGSFISGGLALQVILHIFNALVVNGLKLRIFFNESSIICTLILLATNYVERNANFLSLISHKR